jgi:Tfp pilus assembly protein PilO
MKLQDREKRFVTLAVASAVLFALLNWVVLPWADHFLEAGQQLTLAEKKLRQRRELLASAAQVHTQAQTVEAQLAAEEKRLLASADGNQAGAQLQQWLVQRAAEQKLEIQRTDFLATSPASEQYTRVPVRLDIDGPITQVAQFMNAITHGDRAVAVEEITVSTAAPSPEKRVRCTLVVSALMVKPSA